MIIEVKNISFGYDSHPVLKEMSLSFTNGDYVAIIGPNGAGKSTLLKCMDHILKPRKGAILLDGKNLDEIERRERATRMGFIPQGEVNPFPATVFETILTGRKPHIAWDATPKDLEIVAKVISDLGLDDLALRKTDEMSGGQRQKALFGRTLAQDPEIFLLDEPTANLDMKHQMEILTRLKVLARGGKIVVMAIHDLNLALKYCNKYVVMCDGSIFCAGGKDVITAQMIEQVYAVKANIHQVDGCTFVVPRELVRST